MKTARCLWVLLAIMLVISMGSAVAQDNLATTTVNLKVRAAPSGAQLGVLPPNTQVILEARNTAGDWILGRSLDGSLRGWMAAAYLSAGFNMGDLPVSEEVVGAAPAQAPAPNNAVSVDNSGTYAIPALAKADVPTMIAQLEATPIFDNFSSGTIRQIYGQGRALGNRSRVFTRVGDSITANQPFMVGFGTPNGYNLGSYSSLQATIDYFNVPPRENFPNSFAYTSLAAQSGFNAGAELDGIWSDPALCAEQESPLLCEYRLTMPAIAIVMLGSVDVQIYDLQYYTDAMNDIVDLTIDRGIIPVLNTFAVSTDYVYYEQSLRFNMVILDIAQRRNLPLINLWLAQRPLPSGGLGADRYHLSMGDTFFVFNGEEAQFGVTLRNLLTLQALDQLRKNIPLP